jgi:hypothetical protein
LNRLEGAEFNPRATAEHSARGGDCRARRGVGRGGRRGGWRWRRRTAELVVYDLQARANLVADEEDTRRRGPGRGGRALAALESGAAAGARRPRAAGPARAGRARTLAARCCG